MTLRQLRLSAGKTVKEVAEVLGVSERTVYFYETGRRDLPIGAVQPLAKLFDEEIATIVMAATNQ